VDVQCWSEELLKGKGFQIAVIAVIVNAADNKLAFSLVKESPRLVCTIWEVDEEEEA
jgi:hypothetical protein